MTSLTDFNDILIIGPRLTSNTSHEFHQNLYHFYRAKRSKSRNIDTDRQTHTHTKTYLKKTHKKTDRHTAIDRRMKFENSSRLDGERMIMNLVLMKTSVQTKPFISKKLGMGGSMCMYVFVCMCE